MIVGERDKGEEKGKTKNKNKIKRKSWATFAPKENQVCVHNFQPSIQMHFANQIFGGIMVITSLLLFEIGSHYEALAGLTETHQPLPR